MPGLTSSMLMAAQSLLAEQGAMNVTANNIANANTPGYTRERPVLTEGNPTVEGNLVYGSGVVLSNVVSIRDQLLDLRISEENQQQGNSQAQMDALQQVQGLFADTTHGIGADMTAFFNSLRQLSTNPANVAQRQSVLTAAQNLANSFHQTASNLTQIRTNLNLSIKESVDQINTLTQQIAGLNSQVAQLQGLGKDPGVLLDQETQLVQQLSQLTDVNVIQTEQAWTITTAGGSPLVVGDQSFSLSVSTDATGMNRVMSAQGQDITDAIQNGKLGGTLHVRDQVIPGMLGQLNDLATQFAQNFNTEHRSGYDLNLQAGQDLFSAPATGAAIGFSVLITDPNKIAASSTNAAGSNGDNGNIANLVGVETTQLASGMNPLQSFSNVVFQAGNFAAQAQAEVNAGQASLNQLNDQRGAVSAVSIDEESTNLILYQRAFQAAARVVTTVDQMMQTVLGMGAS